MLAMPQRNDTLTLYNESGSYANAKEQKKRNPDNSHMSMQRKSNTGKCRKGGIAQQRDIKQ